MNTSTFIILCIVIAVVALDIRYLMKNGIESCSGECSGCGASCKWTKDLKKARKAIEREKRLGRL